MVNENRSNKNNNKYYYRSKRSFKYILESITDYLGSERVATISQPWNAGEAPDPDDVVISDGAVFTYIILPGISQDDKRVSINPAIQLLDYMTAKTYGKGLSIETDISMTDFLAAARTCDSQRNSNISWK